FRRLLLRPGFWGMAGVAAGCCLPIFVWNMRHDWVTLRHVLGLSGLHTGPQGGPRIHWLGPLVSVGGQCLLLVVFLLVVWAAARVAHGPRVERDAGVRYLWWLSAPMFALFLGFSFKTGGGEMNWPATAYISGLVLGAAWLGRQWGSARPW